MRDLVVMAFAALGDGDKAAETSSPCSIITIRDRYRRLSLQGRTLRWFALQSIRQLISDAAADWYTGSGDVAARRGGEPARLRLRARLFVSIPVFRRRGDNSRRT